jgi:hypothetical protein
LNNPLEQENSCDEREEGSEAECIIKVHFKHLGTLNGLGGFLGFLNPLNRLAKFYFCEHHTAGAMMEMGKEERHG